MSGFGLIGAGVAKGRFGAVVGKVVLMFGSTTVAACLALWHVGTNGTAALVILGIVFMAMLVSAAILVFSHMHPDLASVEGAQWLQFQAMQAKGTLPQLTGPPQEFAVPAAPSPATLLPDSAPAVSVAADHVVDQ